MPTQDEQWMRIALNLAEKARGKTSPNPLVGAVLVKDGHVVGSGYHQKAGGPHAEVFAFQEAGENARDADLYVTLEPCSHFGRTPPCADACIAAGVRRVVAAMTDPNPKVAGRGLQRLSQAGIAVEVGVLETEAKALNAAYITYITKRRPYVLWKAAATLDGKVATRTGASRWITGPEARDLVHQIRSEMDAIMVGVGTVLSDDPLLTARPQNHDPSTLKQPLRIVVDSRLRVPQKAKCLAADLPGRTIIATTEDAPEVKVRALRNQGIDVWQSAAIKGQVDVTTLLHDLAEMEIASILLEGGPTLAGSMLDAHLIDQCMVFIAPLLFGGVQAPGVLAGLGVETPADAGTLINPVWRNVGNDLLVAGSITWPNK